MLRIIQEQKRHIAAMKSSLRNKKLSAGQKAKIKMAILDSERALYDFHL